MWQKLWQDCSEKHIYASTETETILENFYNRTKHQKFKARMWDVLDKFELGEICVFPLFAYLLQLLSVKK